MRILIINPFGIGDCLFTTPVISAIKKEWPTSYVGFWCNERVSEILKQNPKINIVFPLSRGDIKRIYSHSPLRTFSSIFNLYSKIRKENFDISLDFSLDHRYGLMSKLCAIKRRIGIDYNSRGRFLTQRLEISGYTGRHIVEYYLKLLDFLGIKNSNPKLELFIESGAKDWAQGLLAKHKIGSDTKLIGLCPGAGESWGKDVFYKRWDPAKFASVCDSLLKEAVKSKILLFGNNQDEASCERVYNLISNKSDVIKLYPNLTLNQFAALLERCNILLTNDGGPLHMAVALGIKSVSIFGPVSEVVYGPYPKSENHITVQADFNCRPCYKNFRLTKCDNELKCLVGIKPLEVFEAARRLL